MLFRCFDSWKSSPEKVGKTQRNLSKFYSWVDKNIEIRLGRQKY